MKKILIIVSFLICKSLNAQNNLSGVITYNLAFTKGFRLNTGIVTFNNELSIYTVIEDTNLAAKSVKFAKEQEGNYSKIKGSSLTIIINKKKSKELDIYTLFKDSTLTYLYLMGSKINPFDDPNFPKDTIVFIEEQLNRWGWKIMNKFKIILGYNCQFAIGEFRGRKYNVWFTIDIPLPIGPWKMNGLPGAILEAIDENEKFKVIAINIELKKTEVNYPLFKDKFKQISLKELIMYKCIYNHKYEEQRDKRTLANFGPTARINRPDNRMDYKGFLWGHNDWEINFEKEDGMQDFHKECPYYLK